MSKAPLPVTLDPKRTTEHGLQYSGSVALHKLESLSAYLIDPEGEVEVELNFGIDEERLRYLKGKAQADVKMACQRCLQPVDLHLEAELNLGIVYSDEAAKTLPKRYDPLVVEDKELDVHAAIEEELILTLPLIPLHPDCEVKSEYSDPKAPAKEDTKENPFSVLAQLKSKD